MASYRIVSNSDSTGDAQRMALLADRLAEVEVRAVIQT